MINFCSFGEMVRTDAKQRIVWIEWARSICMFLVVLGHCRICESEFFLVQFIYSFHMLFFFFLSGMLCKRRLGLLSLNRNLKYILLPYLTYSFILILSLIIRSKFSDLTSVLSEIEMLIVGLDPRIGPLWFLPALFICKQFFGIIQIAKRYNIYFYYVLVPFTLLPAYFFSEYQLNLPFFADSALCGLPFFILGSESFSILNKTTNSRKLFLVPIFLLLFSVYLSYLNGFVVLSDCRFGNSVVLYYINAYITIISIIYICKYLNSLKFPFITITSYGSIVILGIHDHILLFFNHYLPIIIGIEPFAYPVIIALIYSSVTFILCYLMIRYICSRYPLLFGLK